MNLMLRPSDNTYQLTKDIMLGRATMNKDFVELADTINEMFGVKPINIIYGTIKNGTRPELQLCFEKRKEMAVFMIGSGYAGAYDNAKLKVIADKYASIFKARYSGKTKNIFAFFNIARREKYLIDNAWITLSAFRPIARTEANEKVTRLQLNKMIAEINNEDIWEVQRFADEVTFFLYTDDQVKKYTDNDERRQWTDKYFNILKQYDEFDYFKRNEFNILLDSKENLDKNYAGSFYVYYK